MKRNYSILMKFYVDLNQFQQQQQNKMIGIHFINGINVI